LTVTASRPQRANASALPLSWEAGTHASCSNQLVVQDLIFSLFFEKDLLGIGDCHRCSVQLILYDTHQS
jgi:hypothetical protein